MVRIGGEKMRRWFLVLAALLLLGGLALATAAYASLLVICQVPLAYALFRLATAEVACDNRGRAWKRKIGSSANYPCCG